jgi:hypothetical protein
MIEDLLPCFRRGEPLGIHRESLLLRPWQVLALGVWERMRPSDTLQAKQLSFVSLPTHWYQRKPREVVEHASTCIDLLSAQTLEYIGTLHFI